MANLNTPILVVDDAKFSSIMIGRALTAAGFKDIRFASSANEALKQLEKRAANILIADWLMPEMDGLELTDQVRILDSNLHHFTYVMLLTAKEGVSALKEAFDRGVDDFINKSVMNDQLLPRIFAADRISSMQNRLLEENKLLTDNMNVLEKRNLVDPLTGLGNLRYCLQRLSDALRHVESREAACCLLVVALQNGKDIQEKYGLAIYQEIIRGMARRLHQLIRPMDILSRTGEEQFAVITTHDDLEAFNVKGFRRLHAGLNLKAFKTSVGYLSIKVGISICIADNKQKLPTQEQILVIARSQLAKSFETGMITVTHWKPELIASKSST
ncbi:GGDEF domain-containing response regulator [Zooshikella harenae]|uniref:Response regulator n=1 Tax=Zooshikella harenae TaxID=2827238 RepID=A0ABS5ZCL2_9GAMM|nr:response regulator [Zooshikella harenae]MBU2711734.1 response regulator [Zooshikella harenae]